jgi:hypothetical protein
VVVTQKFKPVGGLQALDIPLQVVAEGQNITFTDCIALGKAVSLIVQGVAFGQLLVGL